MFKLDNGANSLLVKAFSSALNDLSSFSCDIFPNLVSLFFERSSVLRDEHLHQRISCTTNGVRLKAVGIMLNFVFHLHTH